MANMSSAYGNLTIAVKGNEQEFMKFADSLAIYFASGFYGASFDAPYLNDIQNVNGTCSTEVNFMGWGRWTFDENLRRFFNSWAENSDCEALEKLKGISFKLIFDFVDCEEGMETLYTEKASIEHKANEPWESSQYREIECETLAFTADNLIAYGMADEDSVIEVRDVKELREFLEECTEAENFNDSDLKRYVNNHYGEILHDWEALDVLDTMKEY